MPRLIDADALYKDICRAYDECGDILEIIDKQPTIEPPKGKWLKEDRNGVEYTAVCSECGYSTFWSDVEDYNFCPCCGFPMTEREESEQRHRI